MIGWQSTEARDAAEAIENGYCDEDLDRLEAAIRLRRDSQVFPSCPVCGELLRGVVHEHDGIRIERIPARIDQP